jgi:inorganic pyrophosphatase
VAKARIRGVPEAQASEAQIAVHWREEDYYPPPASFVPQANANDPAIRERFTEDKFPGCFKEYADLLDEMGNDDKVLCVAATDPRMAHLRDIADVPEFDRLEIHHFFEVYKALEPGKEVEAASWADQAAAYSEIEACRQRARSAGDQGG